MEMKNYWEFWGKVFYLKELSGNLSYSLKLSGTTNSEYVSSIVELSCILPAHKKADLVKADVHLYDTVFVSGHFETWVKMNNAGEKTNKLMFIVDNIEKK